MNVFKALFGAGEKKNIESQPREAAAFAGDTNQARTKSMKTMRAARMHEPGGPLVVDEVPVPAPRATDVLVKVKACNVVPNLVNILHNWPTWCPDLPQPQLPAIFGLDPAGVIEEVGSNVHGFKPGDRVYVNPGRSCGACRPCRSGDIVNCRNYVFAGYFGFGPDVQEIFDDYPYGGLAEYMTAPQSALVRLPDSLSFEAASRFGYVGTAYSAMRKMGVRPGVTPLINGATGTLGVGAVLVALGLGATKILCTARNQELLKRIESLSPERILTFSTNNEKSVSDWAREHTETGVDVVVDTTGPHTPAESMLNAMAALKRGGKIINIGGMMQTFELNMKWVMDQQMQLHGSVWFSAAEGQDMADMAEAGTLDMSVFEHVRVPLNNVQATLEGLGERKNGGFRNVVVIP